MTDKRSIPMIMEKGDAKKLLEHLKGKEGEYTQITIEIDRERAIEEIEKRFPEMVE